MAITMIGEAKISDSHRGKRFKITAADIKNGQPGDPCNCAAALALKREFKTENVRVYRHVTLVVVNPKTALRFSTSEPLRMETIVFDRHGEFYPGEYDLYPAPEHRVALSKGEKRKYASRPTRSPVRRTIPNVRPTASTRLENI